MKKRVSLILVLLIVFSVLLSTMVSAEKQPQSKNAPTLDDVFEIAPLEDNEAPRAANSEAPTCSAMFAPAPGDDTMACSHTYIYTSISSTKHMKECSKCGKEKTESHTLNIKAVDSAKHKNYCTKCNYIRSQTLHDFTYKYVNNSTHKRICVVCNYIISTGSHSGKRVYKDFAWYIICDKCHKYIPQ